MGSRRDWKGFNAANRFTAGWLSASNVEEVSFSLYTILFHCIAMLWWFSLKGLQRGQPFHSRMALRLKRRGGKLSSKLSLHKILFHFKVLLWESIILLPPPHLQSLPYCNSIVRPLRNIRPPPLPPVFMSYLMQY